VNRAQFGGSYSLTRCFSVCLSVWRQSRNATLQESSRLREQRGLASRSRCAELEAGRFAALAGSATALEKRMGTVSVMNTLCCCDHMAIPVDRSSHARARGQWRSQSIQEQGAAAKAARAAQEASDVRPILGRRVVPMDARGRVGVCVCVVGVV
jgi:hypothetical protein